MPKRTTIVAHLSVAELEHGYRNCRDATERGRWLLIKLLAAGKTTAQVRQITTTTIGWICEIARRYNRQGPAGLLDLRHQLPGVAPLLDEGLRLELAAALQAPPPDGGQWNGVKVARWMGERLGREIHRQQGWLYLRILGYSPQTPRPTHIRSATKEERRAFNPN
jgi:transposase